MKNRSWKGPGGLGRPLAAKTEEGGFRLVCWRHLGAVLGASWGRLGARIALLGRLGAVLSRLDGLKLKIPRSNCFLDAS